MKTRLKAIAVITVLFAVACGSDSGEVASLEGTDGIVEVKESTVVDVETAWMAFAECLRDNGLEVEDPVVDADGLVRKPELVEGAAPANKKKVGEAYEVCGEHIEGVTIETEKENLTEYADRLLELAVCLREQGVEVDDPDTSAEKPGLDIGAKLKKDWDSPAMLQAREACDWEAALGGAK